MRKSGFTLMEVMIGSAVLAIALLGLLGVFTACIGLNETAKNITIGINGTRGVLEQIRSYNFDTLVGDYSPGGLQGNTFTVDPAPLGSWLDPTLQIGAIYIMDPASGTVLNTNPGVSPGLNLYEIRVVLCWIQRGRIIGEDDGSGGGTPLNGVCDGGEDANADNLLNSPVQLVTLLARR